MCVSLGSLMLLSFMILPSMTDPSWLCGCAPSLKDHKHRVSDVLPVVLEALVLCHFSAAPAFSFAVM